MPPFFSYASYLRSRYGGRAYRVPVDGGFRCPHRDRSRVGEGCAYCGAEGSRAPYTREGEGVAGQIASRVARLRAREAGALLLYFQAYSGTNAPAALLRSIYDGALAQAEFRELIVATRPDCVDAERADLLASYLSPTRDVWVELGLQSAHDRTLRLLNRGHTVAQFAAAYALLRDRGLKIAVHLIFGLPGESREDILGSVRYVAALRPDGIKIHNLHICRDAALAVGFLRGELTAPGVASHLSYVADALELLPGETVIMRLTTDTEASRLLAPARFCDKGSFARRLSELMQREGRRQGRRYAGRTRAGT